MRGFESTNSGNHQALLIDWVRMYPHDRYQIINDELRYYPIIHLKLTTLRVNNCTLTGEAYLLHFSFESANYVFSSLYHPLRHES